MCANLPPKFLSHPICVPKSLLFDPVLPQYYYSIILFIVHYLLTSYIIPIYEHSHQYLPFPYEYYDL